MSDEQTTEAATPQADPVSQQAADAAAQVIETTTPPAPRPVKARDLADLEKLKYRAREERRESQRRAEAAEARAKAAEESSAALAKRIADLESKYVERIRRGEALLLTAEDGGDPQKAVENYVSKSAPEQRIDALARELEAEKAQRQREREEQLRQQQLQQQQAFVHAERVAIQSFTQAVTADPKRWPHLNAEFEPEEIAQKAHEIQQWAKTVEWEDESGRRHVGASYPFEDVAAMLDKQAKLVHDRRAARRTAVLQQPPTASEPGSAPREAKASAAGGQATRSGTQPSKGKRPLTREEEEAVDLAALRAAMAKDAASRNGSAKH